MPHVTASYGINFDFIAFFLEISQTIDEYSCLLPVFSSNFHKFCGKIMKLIQLPYVIACYGNVEHKSKPM